MARFWRINNEILEFSEIFYVDAVNGANHNNGRTPATAFQTIAHYVNNITLDNTACVLLSNNFAHQNFNHATNNVRRTYIGDSVNGTIVTQTLTALQGISASGLGSNVSTARNTLNARANAERPRGLNVTNLIVNSGGNTIQVQVGENVEQVPTGEYKEVEIPTGEYEQIPILDDDSNETGEYKDGNPIFIIEQQPIYQEIRTPIFEDRIAEPALIRFINIDFRFNGSGTDSWNTGNANSNIASTNTTMNNERNTHITNITNANRSSGAFRFTGVNQNLQFDNCMFNSNEAVGWRMFFHITNSANVRIRFNNCSLRTTNQTHLTEATIRNPGDPGAISTLVDNSRITLFDAIFNDGRFIQNRAGAPPAGWFREGVNIVSDTDLSTFRPVVDESLWENQGNTLNPDGHQSNLGILGGPLAIGEWEQGPSLINFHINSINGDTNIDYDPNDENYIIGILNTPPRIAFRITRAPGMDFVVNAVVSINGERLRSIVAVREDHEYVITIPPQRFFQLDNRPNHFTIQFTAGFDTITRNFIFSRIVDRIDVISRPIVNTYRMSQIRVNLTVEAPRENIQVWVTNNALDEQPTWEELNDIGIKLINPPDHTYVYEYYTEGEYAYKYSYMYEPVYETDPEGEYILDDQGNKIPMFDDEGNEIFQRATNNEGEYIKNRVEDDNGEHIKIPVLDDEGNPIRHKVKDDYGDYIIMRKTDDEGNYIIIYPDLPNPVGANHRFVNETRTHRNWATAVRVFITRDEENDEDVALSRIEFTFQ